MCKATADPMLTCDRSGVHPPEQAHHCTRIVGVNHSLEIWWRPVPLPEHEPSKFGRSVNCPECPPDGT